MNKYTFLLTAWLLLLLHAIPGRAQYVTATQDGNISPGEYNGHSFTTATGGTWYMAWDATNLYVAKTGGAVGEPNIVYLDLDPLLPVNGGGYANGNTTGNGDYGVTANLPFRADARVYFTDGYIEIRRRNNIGGWGGPILSGTYTSNTGINREIRLSWSSLTGGGSIPAYFNWLGYAVNTGFGSANYRYDQAPANDAAAGTNGGTTPPMTYYYTVATSSNTSGNADAIDPNTDATNPFQLRSYTFIGNSDILNFGTISVWDFTMNSSERAISRGTTRGNWTISGSLVVGAGTVYFGNSTNGADFGTTYVGNVRVTGGVLKMDQTPQPLNVREDVMLTGGQFILSGAAGGDLNVGRNFLVENGTYSPGTFQANSRTVTFSGAGVAHVIQSNTGYATPFSYLTLNSPSGSLTLNSNIQVLGMVTFTQGNLVTNNNFVDLDGNGALGTERADSHIVGQVRITQVLESGGSNTMYFGNIGLTLTPQNSSAALGRTTVTRTTGPGAAMYGVGGGNGGVNIQRTFSVSGANSTATNLDILLQFGYRLDELNGIAESNLALYQSATGTPPYTKLTTPPSANTSTHTIAKNNITQITSGTVFTLSDGATPLPVTLVSFTATPTAQGTAVLSWTTASERDSKGFGIERQLGTGGDWRPVGYVAATSLATGSAYTFTDKSLLVAPATATQAYYRLRQEDTDGSLSYSPVAVVARAASTSTPALVLSPVPVSGSELSVTLAEAGQAGLEVAVTNMRGQSMLHFVTESSEEATLRLPVAQLAPGVYIVTVGVPGQGQRHARFVKL